MDPRSSLSPWLIAALFAPTAFALWSTAYVPLSAQERSAALQAIALTQLFLAVAIYEAIPRRERQAPNALAMGYGIMIAGGVLLVTQVSHFAVAEKAFRADLPVAALASMAYQVAVIGLGQELWFHGLWMRAAAGRPLLAIFGGSAAFGVYHLNQGPEWIATTAALGLLFAVARWYGAPIWALAAAHGLMNWLNMTIAPGAKWRLDPTLSRGLFIGLILFGTAIIWLLCRRPRELGKDAGLSDP